MIYSKIQPLPSHRVDIEINAIAHCCVVSLSRESFNAGEVLMLSVLNKAYTTELPLLLV